MRSEAIGNRVPEARNTARNRCAVLLLLPTAIVCGLVDTAQAQTVSSASGISAQGAGSYNFSIPSQPLASAVAAFSRVTGLDVVGDGGIGRGVRSPGVSGATTPQQALSRLLAGTGLSYRFTNASTIAIQSPNRSANVGSVPEGAVQLDPVDVSGRVPAADRPFETPGSTSHVSREDIDRVPPTSAGDVFRTAPGVISAGNRVGTSVNPNIRGLQGMGRIATTVDGARQTSSSYRGYIGNRDETYIDPDMVGGIDISKGPSDGVGVGGIGGTINFRTLEAGDIVKNGNTYATRVKGSLGNNAMSPRAPDFINGGINQAAENRPSFLSGGSQSGSIATAVIQENYEFLAAYSKRTQGNYFVGTQVPAGVVFPTGNYFYDQSRANALVKPGAEAFNTSEDTDSFLAKGKVKWGDGQSLELGYLYYGSRYGEIDEISFTPVGFLPYGQFPLSDTRVDTYTAKYKYRPSDNPLVDFRANLWLSDVNSVRRSGSLAGPYGISTTGGDIGNASVFATPLGQLTVDSGVEFTREHAEAQQFATPATGSQGWMAYGPSGVRLMTGTFSKASLEATDWLTLSVGGRYDYFDSEGEGYLSKFPERSGGRFSPNAGVVLTPLKGLQFYGQYKEGYRPPSLRETHWHYEGLLVNNPTLRPEIAKNYEAGVNVLRENVFQSGDKLRIKLSYFDNYYDDYIIRGLRSNRGGQNVYEWQNLDSANYRGFEISGGYDAGSVFLEGAFTKYTKIEYCPTPSTCRGPAALRSNLGSPASSPQQNDYATNYIPPEYAGSVTAGIRFLDQKLTLGARTSFSSTRFGGSWLVSGAPGQVGYGLPWPSYRIYDVFGSYKFNEDNILSFSIENITDEYYFGAMSSAGIPSPGRTARMSYSTTFGGTKPIVSDLMLGNASRGAPGSDWTGLYLGGHLGYGFAAINGMTTTANGTVGGIPATESANLSLHDLTKGFQLGFNYQFANGFVAGIESDISWTKIKGTQDTVAGEGAALATAGYLQARTTYDAEWMATLRARIGYAFDRTMIYATGGFAVLRETEVRAQYQSDGASTTNPAGRYTPAMFQERAAVTRTGWTIGGGLEYALFNNWSVKGEYRYANFEENNFLFPAARAGVTLPYSYQEIIGYRPNPRPGGQPIPITQTVNVPGTYNTVNGRKASNALDMHAIKIGLNYRF